MSVKLIVFDMAGTTVSDDGSITRAFATAMKAYGYDVPADTINPLMGYKKPEAIRMMLHKYEADVTKITESLVNDIHNGFEENMVKHYLITEGLFPLPNAEEVFEKLHARGIKVALNTGFSRAIADAILNRMQWLQRGLVDFTVASNEVEAGRPHPFMIQNIMQQADIEDASQVIKVGDTEVDVNEGRNAGCLYAIAITTGAFTREQLEPYNPSFIIADLAELLPIIDNAN